MKRSRKTTRREPATFIVAGLWLLATLWGCQSPEETTGADVEAEDVPDQVIFEARITDTEGGERRWVLLSDRLERSADSDEAELFGVNMRFFRADTLFSTLTSQRGRANTKQKNLFAWGEVLVVTQDDRQLETEELNFDNTTGLITNEVFNRFTEGQDVMTGYGMEATPELDNFVLKRDVRAEVYGEQQEERP